MDFQMNPIAKVQSKIFIKKNSSLKFVSFPKIEQSSLRFYVLEDLNEAYFQAFLSFPER